MTGNSPFASMIRVDQAGEFGAKRIYAGQLAILGNRHPAESVIRSEDPRGQPIYWIGPPGSQQDAGDGTDFAAIEQGYVSITPLTIDMTAYDSLASLGAWLDLQG